MNYKLGLGIIASATLAWSTPTLNQISGWSFSSPVLDGGTSAVELTDTDGLNDDATAFLFFEFAGNHAQNSFGIYGYSTLGDGSVVLGNTLELFSGANSPLYGATLAWNSDHTTVTQMGTGASANIGTEFGFYIAGANGFIAYSHASLNGGQDMALMFDTRSNGEWFLFGSDVVVAFEDTFNGDKDFNDMVVGISDVRPIPEPGTLGLMGLGLVALGWASRRRKA